MIIGVNTFGIGRDLKKDFTKTLLFLKKAVLLRLNQSLILINKSKDRNLLDGLNHDVHVLRAFFLLMKHKQELIK